MLYQMEAWHLLLKNLRILSKKDFNHIKIIMGFPQASRVNEEWMNRIAPSIAKLLNNKKAKSDTKSYTKPKWNLLSTNQFMENGPSDSFWIDQHEE